MQIEDDSDETLARIIASRATFVTPRTCPNGMCSETFEQSAGVKSRLPNCDLLFCSALCEHRHRKRALASVGILIR